METTTEQLFARPGPDPIGVGRHAAAPSSSTANADDFKTDRPANSGARVACGVLVKPPGR